MKIVIRDNSLVYPRSVRLEKTKLILDWLLEFRFSSFEILAKRIGQNVVNSNRFFNGLIKDGVIQVFQNVHTRSERFVMLTAGGVSFLDAEGRDVSRAVTRVSHLSRYSKILHDIAVQYAVLNRLDHYDEVIWDKNIDLPGDEKPDALLHSKKGFWAAIEYERWRKDTKRIYMSFYIHAEAIRAKAYQGVYYLFDQAADLEYYKATFSSVEWPRYKRISKTGAIKPLDSVFKPDEITNLRNCFVFKHEPLPKYGLKKNKEGEGVL